MTSSPIATRPISSIETLTSSSIGSAWTPRSRQRLAPAWRPTAKCALLAASSSCAPTCSTPGTLRSDPEPGLVPQHGVRHVRFAQRFQLFGGELEAGRFDGLLDV